ncbi:hypothetical protein P4200_15090 [Pseudomonas aeruginosa]|nr:hypothetical protein [Pseudomonas aeruginosa]
MRGHRIELGEIEAALSALPGVARAVAVTIGKPVALAAAFVPTDPTTQPRTDELLAALRQLLPDYMVPTHLQAIDTLPLSGNGKVDRQALVALLATQASTRAAYDPPQPGLECEVADIWREVLQCTPFPERTTSS